MSKFIFKPSYIDFGFEPSTQMAKFIHEGASITLVEKPIWVDSVSISYTPYEDGPPLMGSVTATVASDVAARQYSGSIIIACDAEEFVIPCVYSYDSEHIAINRVIDSLLWKVGEDSFIGERDRQKMLMVAKQWMMENNGRSTNLRFTELPIEDVAYVYTPSDFVDYIGLYTYTVDGYLLPLYVNNNINIAEGQLKDEDGSFVLDDNGFVIATNGVTPRPTNAGEYTYYNTNIKATLPSLGKQLTVANGEVSTNGLYRYEPTNKRFLVNGLATDRVILQYVSDPILRDKLKMDIGGLCIHKHYRETLERYIYWMLVDNNRNVPLYDKQRARREYYSAVADARIRKIKLTELIQVIRGF
jgi:hypothetical protein